MCKLGTVCCTLYRVCSHFQFQLGHFPCNCIVCVPKCTRLPYNCGCNDTLPSSLQESKESWSTLGHYFVASRKSIVRPFRHLSTFTDYPTSWWNERKNVKYIWDYCFEENWEPCLTCAQHPHDINPLFLAQAQQTLIAETWKGFRNWDWQAIVAFKHGRDVCLFRKFKWCFCNPLPSTISSASAQLQPSPPPNSLMQRWKCVWSLCTPWDHHQSPQRSWWNPQTTWWRKRNEQWRNGVACVKSWEKRVLS